MQNAWGWIMGCFPCAKKEFWVAYWIHHLKSDAAQANVAVVLVKLNGSHNRAFKIAQLKCLKDSVVPKCLAFVTTAKSTFAINFTAHS